MLKTRQQTKLNLKLIDAAAEGRTADFGGLLRAGADINAVEHSGTALIAATVHDQAEAVRTLIALGARVDLPDQNRNTPLSHVIGSNSPHIARLLVQAGADLNTTNACGDSLLTAAVKDRDPTTIDELIALQVDVNHPNRLGKSALSLALGDMGLVRRLLDAKADLAHAANQDVLLDAVVRKLPGTAQLLLRAGAKPNAVDCNGRAVLTHAADQADAGLVRSLIAANADPNQGANQQALASAITAPDTAVLEALLEAGACPDLAERAGQRVLVEVFQRGIGQAAAQWIPENSASQAGDSEDEVWIPMTLAVEVGTVEIIEIVRNAGYSVNVTDSSGHSLLMLACIRRSAEVVDALLGTHNGYPGANPNARAHSDGSTPLMAAASAGNPATIKLLLAAGANPNAADAAGRTALDYMHYCHNPGWGNAVQELLEEAMTAPAWEEWKNRMDEIDEGSLLAMDADSESSPATMNDIDNCAEPMEPAQSTIPSLLPYHFI